ncbi:MAG: hypothetical protein KGK01_06385 [Bradyrhizobium sp.]|uniref:hypothetical protein n=1 Tax=Bradyrhizobium sp. TaxID=376 RepID=UPI001C28BE6C|nr:hypothetical protein [Bradyrhizobium sp.]MBU6464118.1 hypothetical protein [Pseudomonadota bacterium]MDE2068697.1 hypothetical protein [Bradyrhizobium sp.]MDE2242071.1 hypothetical protein [Bradyrhizobium sp.]
MRQLDGKAVTAIRQGSASNPKNQLDVENLRQKSHREHPTFGMVHLNSGIMTDSVDNAINGIVAF